MHVTFESSERDKLDRFLHYYARLLCFAIYLDFQTSTLFNQREEYDAI
jgi:hypothetical protein